MIFGWLLEMLRGWLVSDSSGNCCAVTDRPIKGVPMIYIARLKSYLLDCKVSVLISVIRFICQLQPFVSPYQCAFARTPNDQAQSHVRLDLVRHGCMQ